MIRAVTLDGGVADEAEFCQLALSILPDYIPSADQRQVVAETLATALIDQYGDTARHLASLRSSDGEFVTERIAALEWLLGV